MSINNSYVSRLSRPDLSVEEMMAEIRALQEADKAEMQAKINKQIFFHSTRIGSLNMVGTIRKNDNGSYRSELSILFGASETFTYYQILKRIRILTDAEKIHGPGISPIAYSNNGDWYIAKDYPSPERFWSDHKTIVDSEDHLHRMVFPCSLNGPLIGAFLIYKSSEDDNYWFVYSTEDNNVSDINAEKERIIKSCNFMKHNFDKHFTPEYLKALRE